MLPISRQYSHVVFGVIQSGLTSLVASGFGSAAMWGQEVFLRHWLLAWLAAWAAVLPLVLLAAPLIRRASEALTRG
jgi:hypothetical protein